MASSPCNCCNHVTNTNLPSLCPCSTVPQTPTKSSNEEVWKGLKLASLCNYSLDTYTTTPFSFLNNIGTFNSASNLKQAQPTCLTHSSSSIFQKQGQRPLLSLDNSTSFGDFESSNINPFNDEKKVRQDICSLADQRYKRMMKNRESAVRSRARKQAYKKALEVKLVRLTEENSRLKRQVEEFCFSSSAKFPKIGTLNRTTSSPF